MQPIEMEEILTSVRERKTKNQDKIREEQEKVIKIFKEISQSKHKAYKLGYEDGDCPKWRFDR